MLKDRYNLLKKKEERLSEVQTSNEEILDSLPDIEKDRGAVNEAKHVFVSAWIAKD